MDLKCGSVGMEATVFTIWTSIDDEDQSLCTMKNKGTLNFIEPTTVSSAE